MSVKQVQAIVNGQTYTLTYTVIRVNMKPQ